MTSEEFIDAIKLHVVGSAAKGVLKSLATPPGRSPSAESLAISPWYNGHSDQAKNYVAQVANNAAHAAVFGLLCVIDGVRVIESGEQKSEFRLLCIEPDGTQRILNADDGEFLHDLLNAM